MAVAGTGRGSSGEKGLQAAGGSAGAWLVAAREKTRSRRRAAVLSAPGGGSGLAILESAAGGQHDTWRGRQVGPCHICSAKDVLQRVAIVCDNAAAVYEAHALWRRPGGDGILDALAELGDGRGRREAREGDAALDLARRREDAQVEGCVLFCHGSRLCGRESETAAGLATLHHAYKVPANDVAAWAQMFNKLPLPHATPLTNTRLAKAAV